MGALGVEYGGRYVLEGPAQYSAANQISNPSYESGTTGWTLFASSWAEATSQRENISFAGSDEVWVARLKGKKDATGTLRSFSWGFTVPEAGVIFGQKYSASIKVNITDNLANGFTMAIRWISSEGGLVSETKTAAVTGTGVFEFTLSNLTPPPTGVKAQLYVEGTSSTVSDTVFIQLDDAEFRETGPRAVFNDTTDADFVGFLNPESSGLDSPDIREDAADKVEDDGGVHGAFFAGRRPVVLQGAITASSATQRNERVDKLQRASLALRGDGTLSWTMTNGQQASITVRRQQPLRITKGFVKEFQLPLVAADPRIYGPITSTAFQYTPPEDGKPVLAPNNVVDDAGVGSVTWINPNNATGEPGVTYASASTTSGAVTHFLKGTNPGFAIPNEATVLGVEAGVLGKRDPAGTGTVSDGTAKLVLAGVISGSNLATGAKSWGTVEETQKFGGPTNLFGLTPTPADINNAGFGFAYSAKHGVGGEAIILLINSFTITVYYEIGKVTHSQTITTNGSVSTAPVIKVYGPTSSGGVVELKNSLTGQTLKISTVVPVLHFLEIDFARKSVLFDGVTDEYKNVTFSSTSWWELQPGTNKIVLPASTATVVFYADAWM